MFYSTKENNHKLKYNPFKSCVVPRPIAWITSLNDNNKVNIAPFSYFNSVSDLPPTIMFSSSLKGDKTHKDTLYNAKQRKEFVVNIASFSSKDLLCLTSQELPYGVSEAEHFNVELTNSNLIKTPRIKEAKIALECVFTQNIELDTVVITLAEVIGIFIDDEIIIDGKIDITKLQPLVRLGYDEYSFIDKVYKVALKKVSP